MRRAPYFASPIMASGHPIRPRIYAPSPEFCNRQHHGTDAEIRNRLAYGASAQSD